MNNSGKGKAGFTLPEVMIALVILAVGILSIGSMQIAAVVGNTSARVLSEGSEKAGEIVEGLLSLPYEDPLLADTDGDGASGLDDRDGTADRYLDKNTFPDLGEYVIYWNVAEDQFMEDTKTLSVIAVWPENGFDRRIAFKRVIPRID